MILKFILFLQKDVYSYKYMRNSEKLLPEKKDCYSHLYMKDVTDADYTQITKRISKDFKVKKKGEYNDLFVQNNT